MVRAGFKSFLKEQSGISLAEGMIVLPLVVLVFAAFVEFGYAMFQWNQTVKALHYGARLAAVSDSLATDFDPSVAISTADVTLVGESVPVGGLGPWTCGPNRTDCDDAALNRIVYGGSGTTSCQPVGAGGTRPALCQLNPRIEAENIVVTYELSGLGYYARPNGAVATIRMEVRGVTFDLPILGALLGLNTITIPAMPVTVTSEDLNTNSGA